ncbi:magnesium transporter NIPA-domain-containing protein [Pilobolus umbonatus]|nr:magnesium transporter NIPA-domain-containing protein [Pilobolus umbonatus]
MTYSQISCKIFYNLISIITLYTLLFILTVVTVNCSLGNNKYTIDRNRLIPFLLFIYIFFIISTFIFTMATNKNNTLVGIALSIGGNIIISLALNIQKLAHNRLSVQTKSPDMEQSMSHHPSLSKEPMHSYNQKKDNSFLQSEVWWVGVSLMIIGEIGNFLAYGYAPASTIAPLGTTTLVANAIFAPLLLNERFRQRDYLGVTVAILGAIGVVLSTNSKEVKLSPEMIISTLTQTRSIIFYLVTVVLIGFLTLYSEIKGDQTTIFIELGLVALYGSYTVLATKGVSSMLNLTVYHMLRYLVTYILLFVLLGSAIMQLKYLNRALKYFEATTVIPTQFVMFTVSAIVGSAIIYKDFDQDDSSQFIWFVLSCLTEFLGVYFITSKRTPTEYAEINQYQSLEDIPSDRTNESSPLIIKKKQSLSDPESILPSPTSKRNPLLRGLSLSSQLIGKEDTNHTPS